VNQEKKTTNFYLYGSYLWKNEFIITTTLRCENTFFLSRRERRGNESVTLTQDTSHKVGHALIPSLELLLALFLVKLNMDRKTQNTNKMPTSLSRNTPSVSPLVGGVV